MPSEMLPRAWRDVHDYEAMLTETVDPQPRPWSVQSGDPDGDRMMLAIQYGTAIIAALAAALLSLIN